MRPMSMAMSRFFVLSFVPALAAGLYLNAGQPSRWASLRAAQEFSTISDDRARSIAVFEEAGKVIQHPRCMNCHSAGDRPLQGDDSHPHRPLVARGEDGFGAIAMRCTTCHGPSNFDPGHVPGNPKWHL